jgi:hypothetical protein
MCFSQINKVHIPTQGRQDNYELRPTSSAEVENICCSCSEDAVALGIWKDNLSLSEE